MEERTAEREQEEVVRTEIQREGRRKPSRKVRSSTVTTNWEERRQRTRGGR